MKKLRDFAIDFYQNNRELLLYLVFGFLSFLISIISYAIFNVTFGVHELIANIYSWVLSVAFAYVTNKIWVFKSRGLGTAGTIVEALKFFGGRIFTLGVEELIIFVFITRLHFNTMLIKIIAQIAVIGLNYVISKVFVFKERPEKQPDKEETEKF